MTSHDYEPIEDGAQRCRDCGKPFPYDPDADRCAACCAVMIGKPWPAVRVGPVDPALLREQIEWVAEQPGGPEQSGVLNLLEHILDLCEEARPDPELQAAIDALPVTTRRYTYPVQP